MHAYSALKGAPLLCMLMPHAEGVALTERLMKTGCKSHCTLLADRQSCLTPCDTPQPEMCAPGGCIASCKAVTLWSSAAESDSSLGVASVGGSGAGVLGILVHTVARGGEHGVCLQPLQASHAALAARLECLQHTKSNSMNGVSMVKPAVEHAISAKGHIEGTSAMMTERIPKHKPIWSCEATKSDSKIKRQVFIGL